MTHTNEPWLLSDLTIYTLRRSKWAGLDTFENAWSATVQPDGQHKTPMKELEANARRIVECVNALAGIPDPAAYVAAFEGMREALEVVSLLAGDRLLSEDGLQMVKAALSAARTAMGGTNG